MGKYNPTPLAEPCWFGPWCGLWVWPSTSSDEEGGQLLGTSQPQSPQQHVAASTPWEYWEVVLVWEALVAKLTARGGLADLTRRQGTKVFSFPAALYPSPGKTTLWAPQALTRLPQLPPGWVSSQTKPDSGL